MVDAPDLGSGGVSCAGSSPVLGTSPQYKQNNTMNELKAKLTELGLSDEIADKAIHAVADFVKAKIPQEYQGLVDQVLAGQTPDLSSIGGGLLGKITGMFGGGKDA